MVKYEFQSMLYRNPSELANAIVRQYITADGHNCANEIRGFFSEQTDEYLADECIDGWNLNTIVNEDEIHYEDAAPVTWLEFNDLSRNDLIRAISNLRDEYSNN